MRHRKSGPLVPNKEHPSIVTQWQLLHATGEMARGDTIEDSHFRWIFFEGHLTLACGACRSWAPHAETPWAVSSKVASRSFGLSLLFLLFSVENPMDSASLKREHISSSFSSWPLTDLNLCTLRGKKRGRERKKAGTFEEISATQHWQHLMKNLCLLSMEKLALSSGEHSLFIFWKVLFDRPFAVDVTLTKHAVTGLFEYGDRLIITLKTPDNTAEGKWTGLPISAWKDCGWNRVFCSKNSGTNWLH